MTPVLAYQPSLSSFPFLFFVLGHLGRFQGGRLRRGLVIHGLTDWIRSAPSIFSGDLTSL